MKRILFMILFFTVCIYGEEHVVPLGTKGNKLILKVKNPCSFCYPHISVFVVDKPEWLIFDEEKIEIDTLFSEGEKEVTFNFNVANGEANRLGEVHFSILERSGKAIGEKTIGFMTELESKKTVLCECYPNPANPFTRITYAMPEPGHVVIEVYNILGQKVRTLVEALKPAGLWEVFWDGRDDRGVPLSSGTYIVVLQSQIKGRIKKSTRKISLMR